MRIEELFRDLNIHYETEGHKHTRPGWINMKCPFCSGNPGYHLGISIKYEFFHCYRCGGHPSIETLSKLSGLAAPQIKELLRQYGGRTRITTKTSSTTPRMKAFKLPSGSGSLPSPHRKYLQKRNFDPDELIRVWEILGTGPVGFLDDADYKHRIIAPIYWNGRIVSFQGRSISTAEPKYKACPQSREIIHHQNILYGRQEKWGEIGICVEGITDVWRLGTKAFAVFGIDFTTAQVKAIANHFQKVAVVFDDDPQAIKQAKRLIAELNTTRGVKAWQVNIKGDPGSLFQDDANNLVKEIMK